MVVNVRNNKKAGTPPRPGFKSGRSRPPGWNVTKKVASRNRNEAQNAEGSVS